MPLSELEQAAARLRNIMTTLAVADDLVIQTREMLQRTEDMQRKLQDDAMTARNVLVDIAAGRR